MQENIYVNTQILNKDTKQHISKEELQVGQEVLAPHFVGFSLATVTKIDNNTAQAEDKGSIWLFKYHDKYGRWLNELGINKKYLEVMEKWDEKLKPTEQTNSSGE